MLLQVQSMWPLLPTEMHADLLLAVKALARVSQYIIKWNHVQGHQDDNAIMVLSHNAWLNKEVDSLAKKKLDPQWKGCSTYQIPGKCWTCSIGPSRIPKQLTESIRMLLNGFPV